MGSRSTNFLRNCKTAQNKESQIVNTIVATAPCVHSVVAIGPVSPSPQREVENGGTPGTVTHWCQSTLFQSVPREGESEHLETRIAFNIAWAAKSMVDGSSH